VALVTVAVGSFTGGTITGFLFVALAICFAAIYWSPLGARFGVRAVPDLRFLDAEVTDPLPMPVPQWGHGRARYFRVPFVNEKGPDVEVHISLSFTTMEGEPLFDRSFTARWADSDPPVRLGRDLHTKTLVGDGLPEYFDVALNMADQPPGQRCYVFNNESWQRGSHDDFRIEEGEFLVHIDVRGKSVREQSVWHCEPHWTPFPVTRVDTLGT
jgi:hypothetical protein